MFLCVALVIVAQPRLRPPDLRTVSKRLLSTVDWQDGEFDDVYGWISDHELIYALPTLTPWKRYRRFFSGDYNWRLRRMDVRTRRSRRLPALTKLFQHTRDSGTGFCVSPDLKHLIWQSGWGDVNFTDVNGAHYHHLVGYFLSSNSFWTADGKAVCILGSNKYAGEMNTLHRYPLESFKKVDTGLGPKIVTMLGRRPLDTVYWLSGHRPASSANGGVVFASHADPNEEFDIGPQFSINELGGSPVMDLVRQRAYRLEDGWSFGELWFEAGAKRAILLAEADRINRGWEGTDDAFEKRLRGHKIKYRLYLLTMGDPTMKLIGELAHQQVYPDPITDVRWIPGANAISYILDKALYRIDLK